MIHKQNIKIVIIGDGATGKTSYFERVSKINNICYKFSKYYNATQGCNICQIGFEVANGNKNTNEITVHLFDTAGQEKFGLLRDSYIIGCDGVILMYDCTQEETKTNVLKKWIPEIKKILLSTKTKKYVPIIIVGNKIDKNANNNINFYFDKNTLKNNYGPSYGTISHCLISVKSNDNLLEPLNWLLKIIIGPYSHVNITKVFPIK